MRRHPGWSCRLIRGDETRLLEHFNDLPVTRLGIVTEASFEIDANDATLIALPIEDVMSRWEAGFEEVFRH